MEVSYLAIQNMVSKLVSTATKWLLPPTNLSHLCQLLNYHETTNPTLRRVFESILITNFLVLCFLINCFLSYVRKNILSNEVERATVFSPPLLLCP